MSADIFSYEPLQRDSQQFRLLRLKPACEGDIECEIFTSMLDDEKRCASYEALSYTWGGMATCSTIKLDGRSFNVTPNLRSALQHLRRNDTDRVLWIDAICIDQANSSERTHQVGQMRDIYKSADRVIIWLGEGTGDSEILFDRLLRFERESLDMRLTDCTADDAEWARIWKELEPSDVGRRVELNQICRNALRRILDHHWFRRVWVIQEIAVSKSSYVLCGNSSITGRVFALAPRLLMERIDPHHESILAMLYQRTVEGRTQLLSRDLYSLLCRFSTCEATEQRDRVYALLGLCSDGSQGPKIIADYSIPDSRVIENVYWYIFGRGVDPTMFAKYFKECRTDGDSRKAGTSSLMANMIQPEEPSMDNVDPESSHDEVWNHTPPSGVFSTIPHFLSSLRVLGLLAVELAAALMEVEQLKVLVQSIPQDDFSLKMVGEIMRHSKISFALETLHDDDYWHRWSMSLESLEVIRSAYSQIAKTRAFDTLPSEQLILPDSTDTRSSRCRWIAVLAIVDDIRLLTDGACQSDEHMILNSLTRPRTVYGLSEPRHVAKMQEIFHVSRAFRSTVQKFERLQHKWMERQLDEYAEKVGEGPHVARVPAHLLPGMGGLGKSQLAFEYYRANQANYEAVFWSPAGDQT